MTDFLHGVEVVEIQSGLRPIRTVNGGQRRTRHARTGRDPYLPRLRFLRDEAAHDGCVLNPASEIDFRDFVRSAPDIRKGNLVLMDNGNLRATWKDENGTRLGLQFLGGRMVQFMIFKRRLQGQPISRVSGRDSLEGLERQIVAFDLDSLCAHPVTRKITL